jgi:hypothetical protein
VAAAVPAAASIECSESMVTIRVEISPAVIQRARVSMISV